MRVHVQLAAAQLTAAQVSHVRDAGARCFCGWRQGSACGLDAGVNCSAVAAALGTGALADRWSEICTLGSYATRAELFTVMQAYNDARAATPGCDELQARAPHTCCVRVRPR